MSFLAYPFAQAKKPFAEVLPDGRKRLTRFFQVTATNLIPEGLDDAPGTLDDWPQDQTPTGWTGLRLTYKKFEDDLNKPGADTRPILSLIFEQIPQNDRVEVGDPAVSVNQYGFTEVVVDYVQFSNGTTDYSGVDIVGSATGPSPYTSAILKTVAGENDGTLRKYRLTFTTGGEMADVSELRFGGKLTIRTLKYLNMVPPTPSGYTLVGPGVEFINGLPLYSYQFAQASNGAGGGTGGVISQTFTDSQNGTVAFDPSSPNTATGIVVCTTRYVSTPAITSNPITQPSGFVLFEVQNELEAGYVLWETKSGFGSGTVINETQTQNSGALVIYHRVSFGSAPSTPSPTIGGTVTLFDFSVINEDGTIRYDYRWAEGDGEVSRSFSNAQGGPTNFNPSSPNSATGSVVCTITHFTAASVSSNPTTGPSGFFLIDISNEVRGGYKIWTVRYGFGSGLVLDESSIVQTDALVTYHRVSFGSAPSTPSATIGGTVTLFESSVKNDSGFNVYDYRWAEGDGQSSITTTGESDGALIYTVVTFTVSATTPSYPGSGTAYLVRLTQQPQNGYSQNTAVYHKPPATDTYTRTMAFEEPGIAEFSGSPPQFVLQPPKQRTLLVGVEVSYDTAQLSTTVFSIDAYASFYETYTPTDTGVAIQTQRGLGGYLAQSSSTSGTNSMYNGVSCDTWTASLLSSIPSTMPTGATNLKTENEPYLTNVSGVKVYRRTRISYSF